LDNPRDCFIGYAKLKARDPDLTGKIIQMDIQTKFDVILEHVAYPEQSVSNLAKLLVPAGLISLQRQTASTSEIACRSDVMTRFESF
jgi:2-polyprenyl-3-methyl-5-hydroxy-6-metoxy-1,4-benzoquinol methylase